jgi:hypothetical protein
MSYTRVFFIFNGDKDLANRFRNEEAGFLYREILRQRTIAGSCDAKRLSRGVKRLVHDPAHLHDQPPR